MSTETVAVTQANQYLVLDKVTYDVVVGPDDNTPLVLDARDKVLQSIDIDKMVKNLFRADDLLHIAACGVAGFMDAEGKKSLSADVMNLQYKLRTSTGDMGTALLKFQENARNMLPILKGAFKDLYSLHEDDAIARLTRCERVATSMAATAEGLKGTFQGLADEAQTIATDTATTKVTHEKARDAAIARQKEIEAQDAELQETSRALKRRIPEVKAWYEEAKAAQEKADGRMFTLAIVGSITKALGSAVTAGLQIYTGKQQAGAQLANALAKNAVKTPKKNGKKGGGKEDKSTGSELMTAEAEYRTAKDTLDQAQQDATDAAKATKKAQAKFDKLEPAYTEAKEAHAAAKKKKPADAKDVKAKKAALDKLEGPFKAAETALETATEAEEEAVAALEAAKTKEQAAKAKVSAAKEAKTAEAVAAGAGKGLESMGASAEDAAGAYGEIAARYGEEKTKYLDMLMELQDQEMKALGEIAKFAVQIATEKTTQNLEQAAVEALHIAVGVLKQIVVILQDVTYFWDSMALACRRLAEDDLRQDIEIYMKREPAERIREYSEPDFQLRMLQVAAQWHALALVAEQYKRESGKAYTKMGVTYRVNLDTKAAHAEAKRLAGELNIELAADIDELKKQRTQTAAAKDQLKELAA